tara:strand:- start:372 stop:548 length:177 start_codon:yes stop_codon:yes gene_type:complete
MANKKITLEFTQAQLNAMFGLMENTESGIGCSDTDKESLHQLRLMERMLKANGYVRTK